MKLYLDENLSPRIAELLRARGLDAVAALEAGNTQLADPAQLRYATRQGRALVTCDVADFVAIADALERVARRYPDGIPGTVLYLPRST